MSALSRPICRAWTTEIAANSASTAAGGVRRLVVVHLTRLADQAGEIWRGLDEEPGLIVADDEEVDLAFHLVAHVPQLDLAEPEVGPALDSLEQVAGDEGLGALARVCDA